jgi:hypothetical protein
MVQVFPMKLSSSLTLAFRGAVVVLLGSYIICGPAYRQVFEGENKLVRRWTMYADVGSKTCDVHMWTVDGDGVRTMIDRFQVTGRRSWQTLPRHHRRLRRNQLKSEIRRVCGAVDDSASLRVRARCGSRRTWKPIYEGDEPICKKLGRSTPR